MTFLRKDSAGQYYVCCRKIACYTPNSGTSEKVYRNWWLPKYSGNCLSVDLGVIKIPREMEGKKVRFRVEFFD